MSDLLVHKTYSCPYCGEVIETWVDISQGSQQTIEDCSVCCRPIELTIHLNENDQHVDLTAQTDTE